MIKTMRRIVIAAILLIALAAGACLALYNCSAGTPLEGARTQALNVALEQSGIKDTIESKLRENASSLAEEYGIPSGLVDMGIDELAIQDWKIANTPTSEPTGTIHLTYEGSPIELTTYEDPSVLSIKGEGKLNTYGQKITFSVPESVQGLSSLLSNVSSL